MLKRFFYALLSITFIYVCGHNPYSHKSEGGWPSLGYFAAYYAAGIILFLLLELYSKYIKKDD